MHPDFSVKLLATVSLLVLCAVAVAAEPAAKSAQRRPLSRNELRACMDRSAALEDRRTTLRAAEVEHNAGMAVLSDEATALSRLLRTLDNTDEVAVELYNKRNDARNRKVEVSNGVARGLNAAVAELQDAEADFVADCVARPFLKSDEDAILKESEKKRRPLNRPLDPGDAKPSRSTRSGLHDS